MNQVIFNIKGDIVAMDLDFNTRVLSFISILEVGEISEITIHQEDGTELDVNKSFTDNQVIDGEQLYIITAEDTKLIG